MNVARQLYQLCEIDLELERSEQALKEAASQRGESPAVVGMRREVAQVKGHLEELKSQQHPAEWEIDDLVTRLTDAEGKLFGGQIKSPAEGKLFGGQIKSPRELASLQQEVEALKKRRSELEDKALELMGQVELTEVGLAELEGRLKALEAEWHHQQRQLAAEIERLEGVVLRLKGECGQLSAGISAPAVEVYQRIKKQKGNAVARVEQGRWNCSG
jgi:predicted  nucleic acid-binding Zn-ribbon protein